MPNRSSSELYVSSSIRGDEISVNRANAHPKLARFFVMATSVIFGRETVGLILSARTWNIADNDSGRIAVYDNECNYVVELSRILDVWFCRSLLSFGFSSGGFDH